MPLKRSEIDFDAIREVKSHLELYVLQIFPVVFNFLGGKLPPKPL